MHDVALDRHRQNRFEGWNVLSLLTDEIRSLTSNVPWLHSSTIHDWSSSIGGYTRTHDMKVASFVLAGGRK